MERPSNPRPEPEEHTLISPLRIALLTVLAMLAFAANSVLCRMALGDGSIDAAGFAAVRVAAGALTLMLLLAARGGVAALRPVPGSWRSSWLLFGYMVGFSFAYLDLDTGTGALILFGCVQATMLFWALRGGERPRPVVWVGLALALAGLVYLVSPGLTAPPLFAALLMAVAGISWGGYSLRGRGSRVPLRDTAGNFTRALLPLLGVCVLRLREAHLSLDGVILAVASGALASGVGYAIWYAALPGLTATRAAMVQLSVPAIAACGGVLLLGEEPTTRLFIASAAILGGVALAILGRVR